MAFRHSGGRHTRGDVSVMTQHAADGLSPGEPTPADLVAGSHADPVAFEARLRELGATIDRLGAIVESFDGLIYVCSADHVLEYMNRRLAERTGRDAVGETCHRSLFGRDTPCSWCMSDRTLAGETIRWEFVGPEDGRSYDVFEAPLPGPGGRVSKLALIRDVTDARLVEEALRESEERYRRIAETMTDYVFTVVVQDGVVTQTIHGPGCVAITGYTQEDLAADADLWLRMVVPDDRDAVVEQARVVLAGGRARPVEHRIVRKDGQIRWVRNTPAPRLDADGRLIAYDGLVQDITERKLLEEELLQAQKLESIGRLAGGVAHDFNNLLTAILGNAELARNDLPEGTAARADIDEVVHAAERAASLTHQLLGFARRQVIVPEVLDLNGVVAESDEMLRRLLGEDIEVTTVLALDLSPVEADPGQMQQLLMNLAANAREAMPRGGHLFIETANEVVTAYDAGLDPSVPPGRYVSLGFTDTGVGVTDEVRAHMFEPFYASGGHGRGAGLALATCHGIVAQNGGHITVHAEEGQGTTFRILLPQQEADSAPAPEPPVHGPASRGTETILVVEDEPSVRRLAVLTLRGRGYRVIEAEDGPRALQIAGDEATPIDLLLSDVIMPGMSGPELVERFHEIRPDARTLLMSGHFGDTVMSLRVEASLAFLPKPFTPDRLVRKVRETLDAGVQPGSEPSSG